MIKYIDYDITFQEVPDETTLAFNLTQCPFRCANCHYPELQLNIGTELTENLLTEILKKYDGLITCVAFMGGDNDCFCLISLADIVKKFNLKVCVYTGQDQIFGDFDFIKTGKYIEELGGLASIRTNQRFFRLKNNEYEDITSMFIKKA